MSVQELKAGLLALPQGERHEFIVWASRLESGYGDIPGEALDQHAARVWDEDDRHGRRMSGNPTGSGPLPNPVIPPFCAAP